MKTLKTVIAAALCLLLSTSAFALDGYLFLSIQKMAGVIEKACPKSKCVVVSIGRSPTPIAAYLQTEHPEGYVYNLPLTKFRYGAPGLPSLSTSQEQKLFKHFDIYFPNESELKGRNILLIDYSTSGESLVSAYSYAGKYITERQATHFAKHIPQLDMLAFTETSAEETGLHPWIRLRIVMDESAVMRKLYESEGEIKFPETSLTNQRFAHGAFEDMSSYGAFDVMTNPVDLVKKEQSVAYRQLMAKILTYKTVPELLSDDLNASLNELFKLTIAHEAPFDSEVWLNPKNKIEFERLAEQIRWGSTSDQEAYYETVRELLAKNEGTLVSQVAIHRLSQYRGTSPNRTEIFRLALANHKNNIDRTAIELFYMLGQSAERTSRENNFVLEMMTVVLTDSPQLLTNFSRMFPYGDMEKSLVENIYQFYKPVFESRNERLIEQAILQIKGYPDVYSQTPVRLGIKAPPLFKSVLIDKIREQHGVIIAD